MLEHLKEELMDIISSPPSADLGTNQPTQRQSIQNKFTGS